MIKRVHIYMDGPADRNVIETWLNYLEREVDGQRGEVINVIETERSIPRFLTIDIRTTVVAYVRVIDV